MSPDPRRLAVVLALLAAFASLTGCLGAGTDGEVGAATDHSETGADGNATDLPDKTVLEDSHAYWKGTPDGVGPSQARTTPFQVDANYTHLRVTVAGGPPVDGAPSVSFSFNAILELYNPEGSRAKSFSPGEEETILLEAMPGTWTVKYAGFATSEVKVTVVETTSD